MPARCSLPQEHLKNEDASIRDRERCLLCSSFCHTAVAYKQHANDLVAANNALENADKLIKALVLLLQLSGHALSLCLSGPTCFDASDS